jgi:uncharacterized protein YutE (UPF0331/DUF86 family)
MKCDRERVSRYLTEITKNSEELHTLIAENHLKPDSLALKAAKYLLIELAEGISNTLQHILAKEKGLAVNGYIDTIIKGYEAKIISEELFNKLKPFLDFRNSLIHRYWTIDDTLLIKNILAGHGDFQQFVDEIEHYLQEIQ